MRIYGRIQWNRFVSSATLTTGTFSDLTTDLIMANNNNILVSLNRHFPASFIAPLPNSDQINHPFSNHNSHPSQLFPLCNTHNTHHLFICTHIHTTLSPLDLWTDLAGRRHCWPDGRRTWLVDHKQEDRTLTTSEG